MHGRSYSGSSGHDEAEAAPSMSLVDVVTGESRTLEPAEVAAKSVVEVWVERLDPSRGEDFGWRRVGDAVVTRDRPSLKIGPVERFVPVAQRQRAFELTQGRQFEKLLAENLAEKLYYVVPLWSGSVSLPEEAGAEARYRLVIAEYEEYLVDDDRPYDPVPEDKGRRARLRRARRAGLSLQRRKRIHLVMRRCDTSAP